MHDPGEEEGKGFANYAFRMERAAAALFGVVTYGVHMTIYQESGDDAGRRSVKMWVPRRARTKQTCVSICPCIVTLMLMWATVDGRVSSTTRLRVAYRRGCLPGSHW